MKEDYHSTRLSIDPKRKILWTALTKHLQKYVIKDSTVLDFGAGYCDFINLIEAKDKIAYDIWDGIKQYADPDVRTVIGREGDFQALESIDDDSVDVIFASNIFEHFEVSDLDVVLEVLKRKLTKNGTLIALQPNYYYAYRMYFDDYTHKSVWTHTSLTDYFSSQGFETVDVKPKFMPLTVKSRFPVNAFLINLYMKSPIKPFAGQMLVVSRLK